MAVGTPTLLSGTTSASNPVTTASQSPTSGAVLFAVVAASTSSGGATASFTMGGTLSGTWTLLTGSDLVWATRRASSVYVCTNPGASGTVSATYSGIGVFQAVGLALFEVTGVDTTTPTAGETFAVETTTNVTTVSPTTATSPASGDGMFAAVSLEANATATMEAGWTELYDFGEANGIRQMVGGYDITDPLDQSATFSWASAGFWWSGIWIIKASSGGAPTHSRTIQRVLATGT